MTEWIIMDENRLRKTLPKCGFTIHDDDSVWVDDTPLQCIMCDKDLSHFL